MHGRKHWAYLSELGVAARTARTARNARTARTARTGGSPVPAFSQFTTYFRVGHDVHDVRGTSPNAHAVRRTSAVHGWVFTGDVAWAALAHVPAEFCLVSIHVWAKAFGANASLARDGVHVMAQERRRRTRATSRWNGWARIKLTIRASAADRAAIWAHHGIQRTRSSDWSGGWWGW